MPSSRSRSSLTLALLVGVAGCGSDPAMSITVTRAPKSTANVAVDVCPSGQLVSAGCSPTETAFGSDPDTQQTVGVFVAAGSSDITLYLTITGTAGSGDGCQPWNITLPAGKQLTATLALGTDPIVLDCDVRGLCTQQHRDCTASP